MVRWTEPGELVTEVWFDRCRWGDKGAFMKPAVPVDCDPLSVGMIPGSE